MAFPPRFLDELKDRVGLAEVIGRRVRLVRKGHEHQGLCPFHNEKTPSFTVNEDKGFYHCFGCGAHGSVFDFVMNTENMSFPEAVERLAAEAGMEVPRDSPEEQARAQVRKDLYDVVEAAAAWFEGKLRLPEGKAGLDYLRRRGLSDATLRRFRLGYAPDSRGALKGALARDGITEDQMVAAGLLIRPEDPGRDPYDRFRGRVMFPITDRQGRVIAFGGRIIGDGEPKYLNSPETPLFHKGTVLFGLSQAREAVREAGTVVAAEGYMDVIALAQAGLEHAVAPLGTALTEDQIRLLWRLSKAPILCFDGDRAGQKAAFRAAERALPLLKPGLRLRFATLPEGEDPDSLVTTRGAAAMVALLDGAEDLSDLLWRVERGAGAPATPEARADLEGRLKAHAFRIEDETVRGHFLSGFKDRLWQAVRQGRGTPGRTPGRAPGRAPGPRGGFGFGAPPAPAANTAEGPATRVDNRGRQEEILLTVLITHPELYDQIGERLGTMAFSSPALDNLRQEALKTLDGDEGLDSGTLEGHLRQCGYAGVLDGLLSARVYHHAFFARPAAAAALALEGWEETFALYGQRDVKAELRDAQRDLADRPTDRAMHRVRALKDQEQRTSMMTSQSDGRIGGATATGNGRDTD